MDAPFTSGQEKYITLQQRSKVAQEALDEWTRARGHHAPMRGAHEGWAVLFEEVDELWDVVKLNPRKAYPDASEPGWAHRQEMRREALQVAAMAMAFVSDVCD